MVKFGLRYDKQKVPEWESAYIRYKLLKKFLKPFSMMRKQYFDENLKDNPIIRKLKKTMKKKKFNELKEFSDDFEMCFKEEFQKFNKFFEYKLYDFINKWLLIKVIFMFF